MVASLETRLPSRAMESGRAPAPLALTAVFRLNADIQPCGFIFIYLFGASLLCGGSKAYVAHYIPRGSGWVVSVGREASIGALWGRWVWFHECRVPCARLEALKNTGVQRHHIGTDIGYLCSSLGSPDSRSLSPPFTVRSFGISGTSFENTSTTHP